MAHSSHAFNDAMCFRLGLEISFCTKPTIPLCEPAVGVGDGVLCNAQLRRGLSGRVRRADSPFVPWEVWAPRWPDENGPNSLFSVLFFEVVDALGRTGVPRLPKCKLGIDGPAQL